MSDVDFHFVRPEHAEIHSRLTNWSRWATRGRGGAATSPMFRQYRSSAHWAPPEVPDPVDGADAAVLEKAVCALPDRNRVAIVWSYVACYRGMSIGRACYALGVNPERLAGLVHAGRAMLANRLGCGTLRAG